ncbi:MAG: glycosyltransferase family 4 protein [Firmicutes bacterium]|nr:glycosyltransferase family 4 protein [Bacillota bacterium]
MKVGMFTDSYRPYTSGLVRSLETTAANLSALGHEVYIFAPSYPRYEKEAGVFRFASVPSPHSREYTIALPFSLNLRSTVRRIGLDVIHVHSPFFMGHLGARCAYRSGLPLVFTYHTMYDQYVHYMPFARGLSRRIVQRFLPNFCNRCDVVITPTKIIRDLIAERLRTKIAVVPTGIETEEFAVADDDWLRRQYGISSETKILLHVGRLGKEKNIGFVLQAYRQIRQKHPNVCLVLVGDGPERAHLQEEVRRLGLEAGVIFTGLLPRRHLVDSYAGADLFIFASTTETQGLVLGEAKAAGLPAVAVSALGAAEMVNDGVDGYLTPLSLPLFAEKVLLLLENEPLRRAMAERAKLEAEKISAPYMARKLAEVYEEAVNCQAGCSSTAV